VEPNVSRLLIVPVVIVLLLSLGFALNVLLGVAVFAFVVWSVTGREGQEVCYA
jgi:hypothetical protein